MTVVRAELTRDTETFGKMDPFVVIEAANEQSFQTEVKDDAGKKPEWNEMFTIEVADLANEKTVTR